MTGIQISKDLRAKLPPDEAEGIEDFLWNKANQSCFLCGEPMNRASDTLVADHDIPENRGGPTNRANLNLAHKQCNSAKRDNPSTNMREYLRVSAFVRKSGHRAKYDAFPDYFGIKLGESVVSLNGGQATFEFPDGSKTTAPIYEELVGARIQRYCHVLTPREAIYNDDEAQPRTIKLKQIWAIYNDLHINPLHEAPGCRLPTPTGPVKFLMFDGQHKSIANWMMGRHHIVVKVYFDLTKDEANQLVNSVQSKIGKLPLSPFELAAKMADEWQAKFTQYEHEAGTNATEAGFLKWVPASDKNRAKQAFRSALIDSLMSRADLEFKKYIRSAEDAAGGFTITEQQLKSKVLERLLHLDALNEPSDRARALRDQESDNIVAVLNLFLGKIVDPRSDGSALDEREQERVRRMFYQSALAYLAAMIFRVFKQVLTPAVEARAMMEKVPTPNQWADVEAALQRFVDHPVWQAGLESSERMRAVDAALKQNQDAAGAFGAVELKPGYLVGADVLSPNCVG